VMILYMLTYWLKWIVGILMILYMLHINMWCFLTYHLRPEMRCQQASHIFMYTFYVYICVCVCVYVYIYIYMYIHRSLLPVVVRMHKQIPFTAKNTHWCMSQSSVSILIFWKGTSAQNTYIYVHVYNLRMYVYVICMWYIQILHIRIPIYKSVNTHNIIFVCMCKLCV